MCGLPKHYCIPAFAISLFGLAAVVFALAGSFRSNDDLLFSFLFLGGGGRGGRQMWLSLGRSSKTIKKGGTPPSQRDKTQSELQSRPVVA